MLASLDDENNSDIEDLDEIFNSALKLVARFQYIQVTHSVILSRICTVYLII